jgi:triosephosphate isomerase
MKDLILAANWKMHLGPVEAAGFFEAFSSRYNPLPGREVWFFPAAVSLSTVAGLTQTHADMKTGAQNIFWEPKGAFTGELSVAMAREAGATVALVGHSERRHVFGETDEEASKKVRALLDAGMTPLLCVGEKIEQREAGETIAVVERQLGALNGLDPRSLRKIVIAYEPVWAIGTGKTATSADAAEVHAAIRNWLTGQGLASDEVRILYGGSVKPSNAGSLMSEPEIDGVLVGGASLDPDAWAAIASAAVD